MASNALIPRHCKYLLFSLSKIIELNGKNAHDSGKWLTWNQPNSYSFCHFIDISLRRQSTFRLGIFQPKGMLIRLFVAPVSLRNIIAAEEEVKHILLGLFLSSLVFLYLQNTLIILHNNSRKNMLRLQLQSQLPSPLSLTVLHVAHTFRIVCIFFRWFLSFRSSHRKKGRKKTKYDYCEIETNYLLLCVLWKLIVNKP